MKICRNTPPDLGIPRAVLRSWQDVPAINVLPSGLTDHRGAWPSHVRAHAPMHVHMCDSVAHTALSDDVYFAFAFRKRGWFIDRSGMEETTLRTARRNRKTIGEYPSTPSKPCPAFVVFVSLRSVTRHALIESLMILGARVPPRWK